MKHSLQEPKNKSIFKRYKYPSLNALNIRYFWTIKYFNHWGFSVSINYRILKFKKTVYPKNIFWKQNISYGLKISFISELKHLTYSIKIFCKTYNHNTISYNNGMALTNIQPYSKTIYTTNVNIKQSHKYIYWIKFSRPSVWVLHQDFCHFIWISCVVKAWCRWANSCN